ncbi:MAG: DMT family transporter [Synergistaceae bacterium]|nr:DMT family transporter [Synergistaceae bacterium]
MLADLGLLYCALFWGVSFPVMKVLVSYYSPCWLLFLRFSAGALLIYIFFHKRINDSFMKVFKGGFIIGALLFLAIGTQTVGLNYIGGGRSAFISAIYVLLVPLIIWVIKKKFPGWVTLFAACLCVMGMYFLAGDEMSGGINRGDVLTIICALSFAVQIIAISHYTSDSDPIVLSFIEFLVLSVMAFASSLIFESQAELINMHTLYGLLFMITFCTFGCYMIQICAQKYAKPSHASIIMSLESVFGLLSSVVFLNESVSFHMALGCALIFSAVMIAELEPLFNHKNRG